MAINQQAIETHVRGILEALGDDPEREGLKETPRRVAKMFAEVFAGMNYTNREIADLCGKTFDDDGRGSDLVVVRDIDVFSYCEHHMALMYNMQVTIGYLPRGRVVGLSKLARIADLAAKRLQLQERLGSDIAEIVSMVSGSADVAVILSGSHSCMTARGICKPGARTVTQTYRGRFETDTALQARLEAARR